MNYNEINKLNIIVNLFNNENQFKKYLEQNYGKKMAKKIIEQGNGFLWSITHQQQYAIFPNTIDYFIAVNKK